MNRNPASLSKITGLKELLIEVKAATESKRLPIGFELVQQDKDKNTTTTVFLKQNTYGYFTIRKENDLETELISENWEEQSGYAESLMEAVESGRLKRITKLSDGRYKLEGKDRDEETNKEIDCSMIVDIRYYMGNGESSCQDKEGNIVSEQKTLSFKEIGLKTYEPYLRSSKITICSNVLMESDEAVSCEVSEHKRDWWNFLFEE